MNDFQELFNQIKLCNKCRELLPEEKKVVGKGNLSSEVLIVAEGPGRVESVNGIPFVGLAGKLLDKCLENVNVKPAITNTVRCRCFKEDGSNRPPNETELNNCLPFLKEHIRLQQPKLIVLLGSVALKSFFPDKNISASNCKVFEHEVYPNVKFLSLYHPAYILRNRSLEKDYIESFGLIDDILNDREPISPFSKKKKVIEPDKNVWEDTLEQRYFPLHCHTEYSIGDGARTAEEFAEDLAKKGFEGAAVSDHGSLMGIYECSQEFKKRNLQLIIGCEFYIVENPSDKRNAHITILVKDEIGYQNLLKLNKLSFENFYRKPRITVNDLLSNSKGLVCLSGCINGLFGQRIQQGKSLDPLIEKFLESFGDDFYLEVMPHDIDRQRNLNYELYQKSMEFGIKLVITSDSHYNNKSDKELKNVIQAINYNKPLEEIKEFKGETYHNLTTREIEQLIKEHYGFLESELEDMFMATLEISDKCLYRYPEKFEDTLPKIKDAEQKLRDAIQDKLPEVIEKHGSDKVNDRLEMEFQRLRDKGFLDYFCIVNDIFNYARLNNIAYGPGRGSAAASLISYLLQITKVDPLEYDLLFDRFISEQRKELPDIDTDWGSREGREEIIDYLRSVYDDIDPNVQHIITYSTWKPKMALKDVFRVVHNSKDKMVEVNEINKTYPNNLSLSEALEFSRELRRFKKTYPKEFELAKRLEGRIRHVGKHAGGVIVSPNLTKKIPSESINSGKKLKGKIVREPVTSFEKNALEKLNFVKFDLLVVTNVDLNAKVAKLVNVDLDKIPLDDPKVFWMFQKGLNCGIHQFESDGMTKYTRQLKPTTFKHLIDINCLYRPGPLSAGFSQEYIERKNGKQFKYKNKYLKEFTEDTYGLLLSQEQIMFTINKMAGLSWGEAENIRKLVAKSKGREQLEEKRELFVSGCIKNGIDQNKLMMFLMKLLGLDLMHLI